MIVQCHECSYFFVIPQNKRLDDNYKFVKKNLHSRIRLVFAISDSNFFFDFLQANSFIPLLVILYSVLQLTSAAKASFNKFFLISSGLVPSSTAVQQKFVQFKKNMKHLLLSDKTMSFVFRCAGLSDLNPEAQERSYSKWPLAACAIYRGSDQPFFTTVQFGHVPCYLQFRVFFPLLS